VELTGHWTNVKKQKNYTMPTKPQTQQRPVKKSAVLSSADPALEAVLRLFSPLLKFHEPTQDKDEDVSIFWDVRILRGADTKMAHVTGSSTMTGLLSVKMMPESSTIITDEILLKVAQPLAAKFQEVTSMEARHDDSEPNETEREFAGYLTGEEGSAMAAESRKEDDE